MRAQLFERMDAPGSLLGQANTLQIRTEGFCAAAERVALAKLMVLRADDGELIDLDSASCSTDEDTQRIRAEIRGSEGEITRLVVGLIRDVLCGIARVPANAQVAPGSLALPLTESTIDLSTLCNLADSPLLELEFAQWLRLRPRVQRLRVSGHQLTQCSALLMSALEEGLLRQLRTVCVIDCDVEPELCASLLRTAAAHGIETLEE